MREVSMKNKDDKVIRKLDIADIEAKKAIEVKDEWDVEWVFINKKLSKPLEKALKEPPPIKIINT